MHDAAERITGVRQREFGREIGPGAFLGMTLAYEAAMVVAVRRPIEREDAPWLVPATWPQTRTDRYGATPMGRGSRRCAAGCAGTRAEAGIIGRPSGLANDDPPRLRANPGRARGGSTSSTARAPPLHNETQVRRPARA